MSNGARVSKFSDVIIYTSPEDIKLFHEEPPEQENVREGKAEVAPFLGNYVDCRVFIGEVLPTQGAAHDRGEGRRQSVHSITCGLMSP